MPQLRDVAVFCGSRLGNRPSFAAAASSLGATLAERDIGLVYGGASVGLMGVVADAVLGAGGRAVGVITSSLADHEIAHQGLHRLEVVASMHERKARMAELSDAVIMLPGGFGTYEEFMETVTWVHLGIHDKPCARPEHRRLLRPAADLHGAGRRPGLYRPSPRRRVGRLRRSR